MAELKKGDVVRPKSGGVTMTVGSLGDYSPTGPEDGIACVWCEGKQVMRGVFDRAVFRFIE